MKKPIDLEAVKAQLEQLVKDYQQPPSRIDELLSLKDCIAGLRTKKASYKNIAGTLQKLGMRIAPATVAAFCHEHLGETKKRHKRKVNKPSKPQSKGVRIPKKEPVNPSTKHPPEKRVRTQKGSNNSPRIADPNRL